MNPRVTFIVTNRPSSEAPSTTSGAAMFRNITCSMNPLPRKRSGRYRTSASASSVPYRQPERGCQARDIRPLLIPLGGEAVPGEAHLRESGGDAVETVGDHHV